MRAIFRELRHNPAAVVLFVIALVVTLMLAWASLGGGPQEMAHATSPDRTWNVKLFNAYQSSVCIVWIEAFTADGSYLGRLDIDWLEGRSDAIARYNDLKCTDTSARAGNKDWSFPYRGGSKSEFIPVPRGSIHVTPGAPLPEEYQRFLKSPPHP